MNHAPGAPGGETPRAVTRYQKFVVTVGDIEEDGSEQAEFTGRTLDQAIEHQVAFYRSLRDQSVGSGRETEAALVESENQWQVWEHDCRLAATLRFRVGRDPEVIRHDREDAGPPITPMAVEVLRASVASWRRSKQVTEHMFGDGPHNSRGPGTEEAGEHNMWCNLGTDEEHDAEARLVRHILAIGYRGEDRQLRSFKGAELIGQRPHALSLDGSLFLVVPQGGHEDLPPGQPTGDGTWAVRLIEMPLSDLVMA